MEKINKISAVLLILLPVLIPVMLSAQPAGVKPVSLAENLYLISGLGGNIAFLVTEAGVLVVDSGSMAAHGRLITSAIQQVTDKPVRYLVLTHYHYDHANGAPGFPPDVTVISHNRLGKNLAVNTRPLIEKLALPQFSIYLKAMEARVKKLEAEKDPKLESAREQLLFLRNLVEEMKNFKPFKPDIGFENRLEIHLGNETVRLFHPGSGHTDDGCMVLFTGQKVLHTGDMFLNRVCPFLDELSGGDIDSWITVLNGIAEMPGIETLVPGHGQPCPPGNIAEMVRLLTELREGVAAAVKNNLTLEQALAQIQLPSFRDLPGNDLLKYDIEAVYNRMKKEPSSQN